MAEQLWTSGEVAVALGEPRQNITDTLRRTQLFRSGESHARFTLAQAAAMGVARHLVQNGADVWGAGLVGRNATFPLEEFAPRYLRLRLLGRTLPPEEAPFVIALVEGRQESDGREAVVQAFIRPWAKVSEHPPSSAGVVFIVPLLPILDRLLAGLPGYEVANG